MPQRSERDITKFIFDSLLQAAGDPATLVVSEAGARFSLRPEFGGECKIEGALRYCLPSGRCLTHKCDILVSLAPEKYVAIEIEYLSAGPEAFKCSAYDMLNLKRQFGAKLYGIMIFVHAPGAGIGLDLARDYCHSFDQFIGREIKSFKDIEKLSDLGIELRKSVLKHKGAGVALRAGA